MSGEDGRAAGLQADVDSAASPEGVVPDPGPVAPDLAVASLLIPATVGAAFFMEGLDSTIIATSLPQMAHGLNVGATQVSVAMTAYLVSVSMWIAASGWLADRFEARRVYIAAIVVFVLGSLICGLSTSLPSLIVGRMVQGAGGALMTPIGRLILARSFPRNELVRAMAFMVIPGMSGPMLGPVIGGWITTFFSWRWIFFINLPLGLICVALTLRNLKPHPGTGKSSFDALGFLLVAVALVALEGGLQLMADRGGPTPAAWAALALGVVTGAAYVAHARRGDPILDLRTFRHRSFAVSIFGGGFFRIAFGGALLMLPLMFQLGLHASPLVAGVLMGATAAGQIAARPAIDRLLQSCGVRRTLLINSLVLAALMGGLVLFGAGSSLWLLGGYVFVIGLAQSVQLSTLAALNFSGLPSESLGRATSLAAVAQRLTTAVGITATAIALAVAAGGHHTSIGDFRAPIAVLTALTLLGAPCFALLRSQDGADLLRARPK